jgi:hypothetical protein
MGLGRMAGLASVILFPSAIHLVAVPAWAGQAEEIVAETGLPDMTEAALPEAPEPQLPAASLEPRRKPCPAKSKTDATSDASTSGPGAPPTSNAVTVTKPDNPCESWWMNRYNRFVNGPQNKPLTAKNKAWLAARNAVDPFNAITILGEAGISVGSDSHSPYGPGMAGYGRYVGVSFTQDLTGEFIGTFLIPTLVHQDPHYHRMPEAKIPRRVVHAIAQVFWTQGDDGRGMPNYANLAGFAIDDQISNLYVPGRETNAAATAQRYSIGLATAPIGNFITEFLPDLARHIHVQIVIIQRVINQVAKIEPAGQP